jgi:hypothetical protein
MGVDTANLVVQLRVPVYVVLVDVERAMISSTGEEYRIGGPHALAFYADGKIDRLDEQEFRYTPNRQLVNTSRNSISGLYLAESGNLELVHLDDKFAVMLPIDSDKSFTATRYDYDTYYLHAENPNPETEEEWAGQGARLINIVQVIADIESAIKEKHGWAFTDVLFDHR